MLKPAQAAELRKRIERLVEAARADEMKGAQHPDDMAVIETELVLAQHEVEQYIIINTVPHIK